MLLYFLGFLHCLVISVPVWFFNFCLFFLGQVSQFSVSRDFVFIFKFKKDGFFYRRVFTNRGYSGFSIGNCVFVHDDNTLNVNTIIHEKRHCYQSYVFGLLFQILYFTSSAFIYIFLKEKDPYFDNPFERDARRFAGQPLER